MLRARRLRQADRLEAKAPVSPFVFENHNTPARRRQASGGLTLTEFCGMIPACKGRDSSRREGGYDSTGGGRYAPPF